MIESLLHHLTLSHLKFRRPYLDQPELTAWVTLGTKTAPFSAEERTALSVLVKNDPDFWRLECTASFCLEHKDAYDATRIDVDYGRRVFSDVEYEYHNATFFVWWRRHSDDAIGAVTSKFLSLSNYANTRYMEERTKFCQDVSGWFTNWEAIRDELKLKIASDPPKKGNARKTRRVK